MEIKHRVLHFVLASALWVAVVFVLTARWHSVPATVSGIQFGGEPDFVRDAMQEFSVLFMPCEKP